MAHVRPGLPRPPLRGTGPDHAGQRGEPPSGLGVRHRRREPGSRGDAAPSRGRDLPVRRRVPRLRDRRPHRREALGLRPRDRRRGGARVLLRVHQPRGSAVRRARLRRHHGRPAGGARQGHRRGGLGGRGRRLGARLQHHRRAAGGERDGPHRHGRRRVRGARLREGVRRRHRRASLDDLHHPRPRRAGERNLARRHLEERRRPHLDHRRLRSRVEPRLLEHRERGPLELPGAEGRQPVDGGDHRHRRRRREHPLGLPVHPLGLLGLRRGEHPRARRRHPARPRAGQGALPPRQERLLLRARPDERTVPIRRSHRPGHQLGLRTRPRDRSSRT